MTARQHVFARFAIGGLKYDKLSRLIQEEDTDMIEIKTFTHQAGHEWQKNFQSLLKLVLVRGSGVVVISTGAKRNGEIFELVFTAIRDFSTSVEMTIDEDFASVEMTAKDNAIKSVEQKVLYLN